MIFEKPLDNLSAIYWYEVDVKRVVDGDTFVGDIRLGFGLSRSKQYFRLAMIDTPERGQPGYQEAKDYLVARIQGRRIMINSSHDSTGRYKRIIAQCCIDGQNVNQQLLELGYAKAVSY